MVNGINLKVGRLSHHKFSDIDKLCFNDGFVIHLYGL